MTISQLIRKLEAYRDEMGRETPVFIEDIDGEVQPIKNCVAAKVRGQLFTAVVLEVE